MLCTIARSTGGWEAKTRQRHQFYIDRYSRMKIAFQRPSVALLLPPPLIVNA
jgi:hypothetical protein